MANRPHATEWLEQFVVADPPRGEEALALARALVEALGAPQRHARAVHIVGTAGKGSVAARVTGRLVSAGVRVSTHQSPHVHDVRERFMVDGELPAWELVESAVEEVDQGIAEVVRHHGRPPTFFAVTAALSWVLGRRHDVDVFVTEAGIGGRHDATAVLDRPDTLTVVTHIGLDHTEVLGSTVEDITREKAAVMIGRHVAVLGPQDHAGAVRVVREIAANAGVVLREVEISELDWRAQAAATADLACAELATALGRSLPEIVAPALPGRYEVREAAGRRLVLDGAHNADKLGALHDVLADDIRPACVIAALGRGKDLGRCAATLARLGGPVVAITFGDDQRPGPRGWTAAEVVGAVRAAKGDGRPADSAAAAVHLALELTEPGDTVVVTGSFLILGEVADAFDSVG